MHSVAAVLSSLSRPNRLEPNRPDSPELERFRFIYVNPTESPYSSPRYCRRPLFPTTNVNLSQVPPSQQVASPTFPDIDTKEPAHVVPLTPLEFDAAAPRIPSLFEHDNRFPVSSFLDQVDECLLTLRTACPW